ncbi:MAG: nucleotide exchange factor GrpE [Bacteroidetes bacterium]|jgi:molecular chaperone GrpE|nr:nucleotide exchange factor GrpE [Bacteroidota bacterium]
MTEPNDSVPPAPGEIPASPPAETAVPPADTSTAPASVGPSTEQQLTQLKDLLLRRAAEFENYKRRVEQESLTTIRMANEGLILAMLPIMDDLERSLKAGKPRPSDDADDRAKEPQDPAAFYRGVELIAQKLLKVLESQGVRTFESVGQSFDVHRHDALLQVPSTTVPTHTILEEVDRGYTMHDKVIRHAKVVVSSAPPESPAEEA